MMALIATIRMVVVTVVQMLKVMLLLLGLLLLLLLLSHNSTRVWQIEACLFAKLNVTLFTPTLVQARNVVFERGIRMVSLPLVQSIIPVVELDESRTVGSRCAYSQKFRCY